MGSEMCIRDSIKVRMEHFTQALKRVKPIPKSELESYKQIAEGFRQT